MKFGVMNLFSVPRVDGTDQSIIHEHLEEVQLADELGFDTVWLAEHHFSHYGVAGSPLLMGAAVAERTERITIGTAVLVLPFYNPLRLAEEIATLDVLSGGRVIVGCGRGYQPVEFAGFGIDPAEARDRYNETLDVLALALSQENFSYEGKYHRVENVTTYPRPFTPGGPPIVHAALNPESFEYLGLEGPSGADLADVCAVVADAAVFLGVSAGVDRGGSRPGSVRVSVHAAGVAGPR